MTTDGTLGDADSGSAAAAAVLARATRRLTLPLPPQIAIASGVADLGNTTLTYWDTGGPGEAVVLLHPASGSAEFFPYQQPAFAQAGYRVISYARRGHLGSSAGADSATFFAADDVLNLMHHLGVKKFHAVGVALGGWVGLDLAISHPDRVLSLVLACSTMGICEPDYAATLESLRPKAFMDLPVEVRELGPSYRAANPAGVAEWRRRHDRSGKGCATRLRNRITWQALAELRVRVLLVTGDADLYIPPFLLRQVATRMPSSNVVVVPDCGHAVQWEQPEVFNGVVLAFLQGRAAAAG